MEQELKAVEEAITDAYLNDLGTTRYYAQLIKRRKQLKKEIRHNARKIAHKAN